MNKLIFLCFALLPAVSLFPALAAGQTLFDVADSNSDGFLSRAELEAAYPGRGGDAFLGMDMDGDGKLSPKEWSRGRYALGVGQGLEGQYMEKSPQDDMPLVLHPKGEKGQNKGADQGILPPP